MVGLAACRRRCRGLATSPRKPGKAAIVCVCLLSLHSLGWSMMVESAGLPRIWQTSLRACLHTATRLNMSGTCGFAGWARA
jgi:hypothetical protein